MKSKSFWSAFALIVVGIVFGAILVSGFSLVRPSMADIRLGAPNPPVNLDADASSFSKAFIEVAKNVTPEIVQITVVAKTEQNPHGNFFFFPFQNMPKEEEGSGSGIVISPDGYIVTNNHVVKNATSVKVTLSDKRNYTAKVVGTDPLTDLAVIKIDANNLPAAYLGDSDNLKVGQWVMAIGNPLMLTSTVTAGIVSALGRGRLGLINNKYGVEDYIQTDAVINPGNSGGALVDLSGAVIGVNSAIATSGTDSFIGYGFAIPINIVKAVAKDLIAHGKVNRGYIGVEIGDVDDAMAKSLGMDKPEGVIVQGIVAGGAASKVDIKPGDVILKIDGKNVNKANDLQSYIASQTAGTTVHLTLFRDGKDIERNVTLKEKSNADNAQPVVDNNSSNNNDEKNSVTKLDNVGLTVRDLTSQEKTDYKVSNGIMITDVTPYGAAQDQGLFKGIVIVEANKEKIKDASQFKKILNDKKGSAVLLKVVDSKGVNRFVGLDIPK
ncbi:MAG: Do family serine endopeptidase [Ignavibacteriaceae bacterium]